MKFLKTYLLGFVIVFTILTTGRIIAKIKSYKRTGRWNSRKIEWGEITYYSLYSFAFFALLLDDFIRENF
nr:MAG TPA: hypothetical protein [Caudoviricetes sp.]